MLAFATILKSHEIKQTYCECIIASCINKLVNKIKQLLATIGIICIMISNAQISKKIPETITKFNLVTLIVAPSALVFI